MSRLCEEFGCTPLQMVRELESDPEQWAVQIADMRGFARAKALLDRPGVTDADVPPDDPYVARAKAAMGRQLREG